MGIKNLLKFLSEYSNIIQEKDIKTYYGKRIAIDISIIMYQVVIAIRNSGSDLINNKGEICSHILGLFNKTLKPHIHYRYTLSSGMLSEIKTKYVSKIDFLENAKNKIENLDIYPQHFDFQVSTQVDKLNPSLYDNNLNCRLLAV